MWRKYNTERARSHFVNYPHPCENGCGEHDTESANRNRRQVNAATVNVQRTNAMMPEPNDLTETIAISDRRHPDGRITFPVQSEQRAGRAECPAQRDACQALFDVANSPSLTDEQRERTGTAFRGCGR